MIGTWKNTRLDPDIVQKFEKLVNKKRAEEEFEELVRKKRAEERESWANKEGPMSRCDSCKTVPDNRLKTCSRCKLSLYCNSFCQRRDWPTHKLLWKGK